MPPAPHWGGKTRDLIAEESDPWITPAEDSGLTKTPRYRETVAFARRLADASPELSLVSLGKSDQQRDIWMLIAASGASTPEAVQANGRPTVLVQAGIHAGEIDGKDAGLMLLRDLTVGGKDIDHLLDQVNFLFIPILSVDGHERFSATNRFNQRGPQEMGWRSNRRNLNLNRDYSKLDTPGIRAVVQAINDFQPDLYVDVHVTNGEDYQYDITYGWNVAGWSPKINEWLNHQFRPFIDSELDAAGHVPGPLVLSVNQKNLDDGFWGWTGNPRFSNGYRDARHLATVLVENHSLKPYDQRVLGSYIFLRGVLRMMATESAALREATVSDRDLRPEQVPLAFTSGPDSAVEVEFAAIRSRLRTSAITGTEIEEWLAIPETQRVQRIDMDQPLFSVSRPSIYYIPAPWAKVAHRLQQHGIKVEAIHEPIAVEVAMYRLPDARLADSDSPSVVGTTNPFEGHARVDPGIPEVELQTRTFAPGSFRVSTDQPLGDLAMLLLEPQAPDSFFQWGFFLEILNRTEYFDDDVLDVTASKMLETDEALRLAFEAKLAEDPEFAADPAARLMWFYRQTPYYDSEYLLYPVARSSPAPSP